MKRRRKERQGDIQQDIERSTLAEYLQSMEKRGISPNIASFVGAATVREHVIGSENKASTPEQAEAMRERVRKEMEGRAEDNVRLAEAIHRLSGLPATNLGLDRRGLLEEGQFAEVVVFDPATTADRATCDNPHQYAVGVRQVLVNGVVVLEEAEHTGALPGRALYGPGRVRPPS